MMDLTRARKIDNFEDDATGGTLWTSTSTFDVVVPAGKRWIFMDSTLWRSDADAANFALYNAGGDQICRIATFANAAGYAIAPTTVAAVDNLLPTAVPIIGDATDYFRWSIGGAQGATAYASVRVLELQL